MNRIVIIAGLAIVAGLTASLFARASDDAPLKFRCMVRDAQILPDRTHVRCANRGLNGLSEFAAETNQPYANQVAAAIVQALRTGTTLVITYAPSDELNPDGCNRANCRKILDVGGNGLAVRAPLQPMPSAGLEPQIEPADFDPVDSVVDEPDAAPPPRPTAATKPAPPPFTMRPIPN